MNIIGSVRKEHVSNIVHVHKDFILAVPCAREKITLSIDFKLAPTSWYFQSSPILNVSSPGAWRQGRGGGGDGAGR